MFDGFGALPAWQQRTAKGSNYLGILLVACGFLLPLLAPSELEPIARRLDQLERRLSQRGSESTAEPAPTSTSAASDVRESNRSDCPQGIQGKGLRMVESYPPRPYFESFNLWRTRTHTGRTKCLTIVAGRQIRDESEGESDPAIYEPNGWLLIFGDYRHEKDGIASREVPLPKPVRILGFAESGYRAVLRLQSLADCSTIAYDVGSARFVPDHFMGIAFCPKNGT